MSKKKRPQLFGLKNTNRDFESENAWGKNQFNSSFPAALCCYMHSLNKTGNYLCIRNGDFVCDEIAIDEAFNTDPLSAETFYAFEGAYSPFQKFVIGSLPRTDLVIQNQSTGECIQALEVKLTALPDNSTYNRSEEEFGCELVVRPDTIVYLACSIANDLGRELLSKKLVNVRVANWTDAESVRPFVPQILSTLRAISDQLEKFQTAFLLQPIWKTAGKSPQLKEHCLDVFFWSDAAFTRFITGIAGGTTTGRITRQERTAIWLYKMLLDYCNNGKFDHQKIIDQLSFNTRNDKAFSSPGRVTNSYMRSHRLLKPMIKKDEIKNIILGGGQNLLSPERRFDAIIFNSPELFE